MRVLDESAGFPEGWEATAVSIGAYDGLHLGHRALLGELQARARERGLASVVVTFDRHPAAVVRPSSAPMLLTDVDQKLELLATTGIDGVLVVRFDADRAAQPPESFVVEILVERLRARLVVVGSDFHFGRARRGNLALLSEMGRQHGFAVEGIDLVPAGTSPPGRDEVTVEPISSTRIRSLLSEGRVEVAAALLGRDHEVRGVVVPGDGRGGRELGYPTANIRVPAEILLPKDGIYAGWATVGDGRPRAMVASIGTRPTFYDPHGSRDGGAGDGRSLLEVHILDFSGDLYGEPLSVRFRRRLRDEAKFDSADDLVAQMDRDVSEARRLLAAP